MAVYEAFMLIVGKPVDMLSENLKQANMMKISIDEGQMTGIRPLPSGGFLAWSTEGNLYRVMENSTFYKIASGYVVLAFPYKEGLGIYIVSWNPAEGLCIQSEHKGFNRYDSSAATKPSPRVEAQVNTLSGGEEIHC
jgi:hypothetical protein